MMRVYVRLRSVDRYRLNYVGINGPLGQPAYFLYFVSRIVKHLNEHSSNGLSFQLGVAYIRKGFIETIFRINSPDVKPHVLVRIQYIPKLIFPKKAIIHKNAVKLWSDCFVQ